MFITALTISYSIIVGFLLIMILTKQKNLLINWAVENGYENNFFIRVIRGTPKEKQGKSNMSKAMLDHYKN